ncbi:MerR family DNA-binding transcriptional regulator [Nocardia sp. 004]|uniref:MerR family DNA-binding transcriptional regulator n=1 Tax=Nocardia sp. 004 TaxID=3385978 RepID=UPI0039A3C752
MANSEPAELITIGVLARASGLTASVLRFYDDYGYDHPYRANGNRIGRPRTAHRAQCFRADRRPIGQAARTIR